eukprot:gene12512-13796_t
MSASSRETRKIHATLMAKVNGQEARIMIDTGASSSYVCSDLISKLSLKPARTETSNNSETASNTRHIGAADYQRIRTTEQPVLGDNPDCDPGAEFTMLGWMLYGRLGSDSSAAEKSFFLNSSKTEFERLCSLDILGLEEPGHEQEFHESFTSNLLKSKENFYENKTAMED